MMQRRNSPRLELHFDDGRVEVVDDLPSARRIASQRPDHTAEIWAVSRNDLGVGWRVDRIDRIRGRRPERR
jgi:hypothetical protein